MLKTHQYVSQMPQKETVPLAWAGELLVSLRKEQGLSQQQLAERLGAHQQAIGRWESAKYRGTSLENLVRVAQALGADIRLTRDFAKDNG